MMRTKYHSTDGTYGQEASKQGLIMPPTFKHMNPQDKKIDTRNPQDLSDIEKLKSDAARLSFRADRCAARIIALEALIEELAIELLGATPELAALIERKEQHYIEAMKGKDEYNARKKRNQN